MNQPRIVEKPWGHEEIWAETPHYVGKILFIRQGHRLSLQHHEVKHETIRVMRGRLELTLGRSLDALDVRVLGAGVSQVIGPGTIHRMRALEDVEIIEVSTTELDDVVRHLDDYGRV